MPEDIGLVSERRNEGGRWGPQLTGKLGPGGLQTFPCMDVQLQAD